MIFLKSNETKDRLLRTILQGILGVIVANIDIFVASLTIQPEYKPVIVALVMAVLSPIMSELGKKNDLSDAEVEQVNSMDCAEPEDSFSDTYLTEEELEALRMEGDADV